MAYVPTVLTGHPALTLIAILGWLVVPCSALRLHPVPHGTLALCFILSRVTRDINGRAFYDYYGFI
ncbi:MAG TPA: hypothetical protein DCR55_13260 [Lentisphaeria bacterium]|nr:hypothetical protein [Lentisphaeria bacterium]